MALGTRLLTLALLPMPPANAAVVAQVPGAQAFWAEGSEDGRWLWVTYGEKDAHGWLLAAMSGCSVRRPDCP